MKQLSSSLDQSSSPEGDKNCLNSELWHACAGPLVSLPCIGSHVVYFPQGHSEQVCVSTNKETDGEIPNYPSLQSQLICQLHNVMIHADTETDEVYAQMTLQPLTAEEQNRISFLPADLGSPNKQPTNYFFKILTASDTSTHGGFSVPRRAAEKVFPPLDFSQQPPTQELIARDLHNVEWKFKHIFRGQPKRHLLTTGWSVFVSAKRLVAGDSVVFIWNEKNQLLLGIRRANRPETVIPTSVLSSDSMHLGLLAAAAHAASTYTRFTVFYNPRASPSEFIIPLAKYLKAVYHTRVSVGMRFRMLFITDESSVRRYMGTITGISDSDPLKWPNSHWRSVKVGWDESAAGGRQPRVSLWEIEPLTTFPIYPSSFPLRLKRYHSFSGMKADDMRLSSSPFWLCGDGLYHGMGFNPWLQQQPRLLDSSLLGLQTDIYQTMANAALSTQEGCNVGQFQQSRAPESRTSGFIESQMLQNNSEPSAYFLENHAATEVIEPQLLHQSSFSMMPMQMQIRHQYNEQPHLNYQVQLQGKQSLSNAKLIPVDSVSPLHSVLGSAINDEALSFRCRPTKRIAVDPLLSGNMNAVAAAQSSGSLLPPFPGVEQPESNDPQNHLLFGVNIDSSSPLGLPNNSESGGSMAFPSSSYVSGFGADCSLNFNPKMSSSTTCIDESDFILSADNNLEQAAPLDSTFVKVYKSGSFGRSLDITKFSSYHELRSQLARMFGLEGQLEDPVRSGWQLVFVDRENDVLLLGDDPWEEFVNSVWCIRILSPQEVQEMRKLGMELLSSCPPPPPQVAASSHRKEKETSSCGNGYPTQTEEVRSLNSVFI